MTNVWLAVLAMVSIVELAGLIALVVLAIPVVQRLDALIASLQRDVGPAVTRAHEVMDQMDDVAARMRRLDDDARFAADRVKRGVQTAVAAAAVPLRLLRGVGAALNVFRTPAVRRMRIVEREERGEHDAEARFVYEGGQQPRPL